MRVGLGLGKHQVKLRCVREEKRPYVLQYCEVCRLLLRRDTITLQDSHALSDLMLLEVLREEYQRRIDAILSHLVSPIKSLRVSHG